MESISVLALVLHRGLRILTSVNYLAHGIRYLQRPHFLVGTAIPDLMSVVNRKSRVRKRTIEQRLPELSGEEHELALGMLQHLHDDQWFHGTAGFYQTTGALSQQFRQCLGPDEDWNCGFLGHVVTELLMDATLCEDYPRLLSDYYLAFVQPEAQFVERLVSSVATQPATGLSRFLDLFVQERFLADYANNERLLYRLNQVMKRVGARTLPADVEAVLTAGRSLIRDAMPALLPQEHFEIGEETRRALRPPVVPGLKGDAPPPREIP